jgi:pyruvate ferredoxin oxidoreductase alpha subunit
MKEIFSELANITGRNYGGLIEAYRTEDAEIILVAIGSLAGTIKEAVDELRSNNERVGLVKIRCYRPFPHEDIWDAIKGAKIVLVTEANFSMGSEGAIGMDLKSKLYGRPNSPHVVDFITGLGGREVNKRTIYQIVQKGQEVLASGGYLPESYWVDLNRNILP